jgi:hypothetical protein
MWGQSMVADPAWSRRMDEALRAFEDSPSPTRRATPRGGNTKRAGGIRLLSGCRAGSGRAQHEGSIDHVFCLSSDSFCRVRNCPFGVGLSTDGTDGDGFEVGRQVGHGPMQYAPTRTVGGSRLEVDGGREGVAPGWGVHSRSEATPSPTKGREVDGSGGCNTPYVVGGPLLARR